MKIIVLMEDRTCSSNYIYEHGLSIYIETKKHKILMDTGASSKTWENAKALGIDLNAIDIVVISHGHYDHAGGLLSFVKYNNHAKIYMHEKAIHDYYHFKNNEEKYIGIDHDIEKLDQLVLVNNEYIIDDQLSIFSNITGRTLWPDGNRTLHRRIEDTYIQDQFDHEQCLVIHEDNQYILLSGCAHNGILNILDKYHSIYECYPTIVYSGFHTLKSAGYLQSDLDSIHLTAKKLKELPTKYYTGHCTGIVPYDLMKEELGNQLDYMYVGNTLEV